MSDVTGAGAVATAISSVIDRVMDVAFPDPLKKASAEAIQLRSQVEAMMAPVQGQLDINKIEAASASRFVAGWRPAVGWVGVFTLAWNYVLAPILGWFLVVFHLTAPPLPALDGNMATLLFGLLGLNIGARTYEKVQNVAAAPSGPIRRS